MGVCKLYAEIFVGNLRAAGWGNAPINCELSSEPPEVQWQGGEGLFNTLRARDSTKDRRDRENKAAIGGLRRPVWAVERLPVLRDVGEKIRELFENFTAKNVEAAKASEGYGSKEFIMKGGIVKAWAHELREFFGVKETTALKLKPSLGYTSPVDMTLL